MVHVDRRSDTSFARIQCQPLARLQGVTHVMVLAPVTRQVPQDADGNPQQVAAAAPASAPASAASPARPASAPPARRAAAQGARR